MSETISVPEATSELKEWTVMIYMAGDNNLSVDMSYALEQIKSVTEKTDKVNLFVYFDGFSSNVPTLYCDFTEPNSSVNYYRSYLVKNKLIVDDINEFNENSAATKSVLNFVDWCVNKVEHKVGDKPVLGRKANNYAMIFSGHSLGFESVGLFKDEKADDSMSLKEMKEMFDRIISPELLGKKISILGFDSCVMSMLEIGCQFKKIAETMVASEGSIPNAGWSYAQLLLGKISEGEKDAKIIAASFVDNFIRQQNKFSLADISVDMAAWDLAQLDELETSFTTLVGNLTACFADIDSLSYKQMKRVLLQTHWQCQSYMMEQNIDLGDFCQLLIKEIESLKTEFSGNLPDTITAVSNSCGEVLKNIRKCIILTGFTGGDYQFSNGISLFFPWSLASYKASQSSYEDSLFISENEAGKRWNEFLITYLEKISLRKSRLLSPTDKDGNVDIPSGVDTVVYNSYRYMDNQITQQTSKTGGIGVKIPDNPKTKGTDDGKNKIPDNPKTKGVETGGTRQAPDDVKKKMFDAINIFLTSFKELKNVESYWYYSGFTSNQVTFEPDNTTPLLPSNPISPTLPVPDKPRIIIRIPKGTDIQDFIGDNVAKLSQVVKGLSSENLIKPVSDEVLKNLHNELSNEMIEKLKNSSINELTVNLTQSLLDRKDFTDTLEGKLAKELSSVTLKSN